MPQPLQGIRIIEWAEWVQGPLGVSFLADMGAEVIKIEVPGRGDALRGLARLWGVPVELPGGRTLGFEVNNRNKKGIAVDLSREEGREVVYRLVERSDVFVRGYRRQAAEKLGLDYPTLRRYNPRLIYAACSGLGPEGEESDLPAFDWVANARSGLLRRISPDMKYVNLLEGAADISGSMTLANGILSALLARERLGISQEVNTSLLGSMLTLIRWPMLQFTLHSGQQPPLQERTDNPNPLVNVYRCADGRWLAISLYQSQRHWADFCRALGREELIDDPRFQDGHQRRLNCRQLTALLDEVFASRDSQEWQQRLTQADLVFSLVNTVEEVVTDRQAWANRYIIESDHPDLGRFRQGGFAIDFSETPCALRQPAPQFGEHTEGVLTEICGYSWEEVAQLREAGVI